MTRWIGMAALMLATGLAFSAWAGDDEDCRNAFYLVQTDPPRAVAACRREANKGNAVAQNNLGVLYFIGKGVPQDKVQAGMWLSLAEAHGFAGAAGNLAEVTKLMTPSQLEQAKALAAAWKPTTGQ